MTISYEFIDTSYGLIRLARRLAPQSVIAVDLEADSMHHFHEKVCLLQLAAEGVNAVVDPLAIGHLAPLASLLADPGIRKVFHGADYDVRCLYRDFQIEIENLFDTQLACRFLGFKATGLEAAGETLAQITCHGRVFVRVSPAFVEILVSFVDLEICLGDTAEEVVQESPPR